jgi:hypothetical protein
LIVVDVQDEQSLQDERDDPGEKLLMHLLRHPCDLVDTRKLMQRFHASVHDAQYALDKFEQLMPPKGEKTTN